MAKRRLAFLLRSFSRLTGPDLGVVTDGCLLERFVAHRDEAAFETLVARYGGLVLGLCRRLLGDDHDADDAFQATFLVLARKAGSICKQESVGTWLYGVAYRVSLEARARTARRRAIERQVPDMKAIEMGPTDERHAVAESRQPDPAVEASWRELHPVLDEEVQRLPEKYRAPLVLCYLLGKSNEEAAQHLSWPTGTVKGRLSRARDLLRTRLENRGVVLSAAALVTLLGSNMHAAVPECLTAATLKTVNLFALGQGAATSANVRACAEGALRTMMRQKIQRITVGVLLLGLVAAAIGAAGLHLLVAADKPAVVQLPTPIRSAQNGAWSAPATWEGSKVPGAGARVDVRAGHRVVYDVNSDVVLRSVSVHGTLSFVTDKDTRMDVGLIKIQPGEDCSEDGFECEAHVGAPDPSKPRPALEVGTPDQPVAAEKKALIRLVHQPGMDKESCPALVCCGGRMDFHGAPLSRTWVKLGESAKKGDTTVALAEPVTGWRVGDRIIVTATRFFRSGEPRVRRTGVGCASEKIIRAIDGNRITLDGGLEEEHLVAGEFRPEVANLSRSVVVESAEPAGERGHTMYHRHSAGSISYAEFRHLGKPGVLGRYALHFHLVGNTMRGSYLVGASIWDSGNRWVTIHGTNYLVVRDCVGYLSKGHGFYLEDGTEVYNVFERNLAVGAERAKKLPKQVLAFDQNNGAGFWWANNRNTFTRNVATGNDTYGYHYEVVKSNIFDPVLPIHQPDGSRKPIDVRTLPFVRFDDNECHHDGTGGFNFGEGVDRVGPDQRHPSVIRNLKIWRTGYAFRPQSPSLLIEGLRIHSVAYGVYHPNYDRHVYRNVHISDSNGETFNRGHDDLNVQYGQLTVDGLTFENCGRGNPGGTGAPLIQICDNNATGEAVAHFRNIKVLLPGNATNPRTLVNRGVGLRNAATADKGVPVFLHDQFGPGRHAKVVSTAARDFSTDGNKYRAEPPLTGDESRVAEVAKVDFPRLLDPVDDLPPATIITHVFRQGDKVVVRGTTADNGTVTKVLVNGEAARSLTPNFAEWEVELTTTPAAGLSLKAHAEDAAGNVESKPHLVTAEPRR